MRTNRWRGFLLRYFTCSRKEKNAALLLGLILLIMQGMIWFRHFSTQPGEYKIGDKELKAWQMLRKADTIARAGVNAREFEGHSQVLDNTPFDPNDLDEEGYVKRGLSRRQAAALIRYRERIGGFKCHKDMEKIFVLPVRLLNTWKPLMAFKKRADRQVDTLQKRKQDRPGKLYLDINTADSVALMQLPLVGAGRARAIVRYRERLGGYYDIAQLNEIRVMPDSVVRLIAPLIHTGEGVFRKIELNKADSISHPYLSKQMVRLMVNYRQQHGFYNRPGELLPLPLFDEEIIRKLAPYLKFNQ